METNTGDGTSTAANVSPEELARIALKKEQAENLQRVVRSGSAEYFTQYDAVIAFHAAALLRGVCHIGEINKPTPSEVVEARKNLINEEVNNELFPLLDKIIGNGGCSLEQRAELLDHIVDSVYVLLGLAANMGLPFDVAFGIVHAANMDKLLRPNGPIFREDGKVMKPEGWVAPDKTLFDLCLRSFTMAERNNPERQTNLGPAESLEKKLILPAGVAEEQTTKAQNQ